ncbi:thermosome [Methanocella paludicola SANAE]|uniref:Thermosome n=1 Tax=Methanocella paludicola (strain DSM 17711 / JCM 13418 / NBRC 101707 / SANAE) TaxID=304371 RepID=D1YWB4_METPS|nr:thermosome subunit alpha [Methanocella paludicola]BAI60736.1 thermosome [Methanocella paludicola SANAE]
MAENSGQPIYILREGTSRSNGREAQNNNIMAALAVADAVRSTLGPKGMDKMLVDSTGNTTVTNDGVTILKEIDIEHPAAKMVVEVAKTQDQQVGDGTTTAVIFAGALLKKAQELMDQGIHPTIVTSGYRLAAAKANELLSEIAIPAKGKDILKKVAYTAMTGKSAGAVGEVLAGLAVDAVLAVEENGKVDVDNIKVEKKTGANVENSRVVRGLVLNKHRETSSMPRKAENAKVLLLNVALDIKKTEVDASIKIRSPMQMQSFLEQEESIIRRKVDSIKKSGATVVFCQKAIADLAAHYMGKAGIMAFKSMSESDMAKLSKATGGRVVTKLDDIDPKDLGFAGVVEERLITGEDDLLFIEGCKNPKALTILLRGSGYTSIDEYERALHDALRVVGVVIEDKKVVPGGGAPEIELGLRLRDYASTVGGREQLAIEAFAAALDIIPRTLAENAGLDPIDMLVELRSKHENKGGKNFGLDVFQGKPVDMLEANVLEPLRVKTQAIGSATEAATMILRIDDVIASGGPSDQEVAQARAAAARQLQGMRGGMGGMPPGMGM